MQKPIGKQARPRGLFAFGMALLAALISVAPITVGAQVEAEEEGRIVPPAQGSLASWARRTWFEISDRDGSFFGRLAEEGVFQRFNPLQDPEYHLDLIGGGFSLIQEGEWQETPEGLRLWVASISHPHLVDRLEARKRMALGGGVDLWFEYFREETLEADRDLAFFTFDAPDLFAEGIGAFTGISLKFFKPDADIEAGFRYRSSGLKMAITFGVVDAFNDFIFQRLGVEPGEVEAELDYLRQPLGARLTVAGGTGRIRGELQAGGTTPSTVQVTFPLEPDRDFEQRERAYYAGGLLEVDLPRRWTLGGYATQAHAETDRHHEAPSSASGDFRLDETTQTMGAYLMRRLSDRFSVEIQAERLEQPETRDRPAPALSVDHDDDEWWLSAMSRFRPGAWIIQAGYLMDHREAGPLAEDLSGTNQRLLVDLGFQFTPATRIEAGAGLDLDFGRAEGGRFDGGHLRLLSRW